MPPIWIVPESCWAGNNKGSDTNSSAWDSADTTCCDRCRVDPSRDLSLYPCQHHQSNGIADHVHGRWHDSSRTDNSHHVVHELINGQSTLSSGSLEDVHMAGSDEEYPLDPELVGSCVLVVQPGGTSRRRLLHSMKAAGVRLVGYAPKKATWAGAYIDDADWILGPLDDYQAAWCAIQEWLGPHHPHVSEAGRKLHGHAAAAPIGAAVCSTSFGAVLCYDEYGVEVAAQLAETWGMPHQAFTPYAVVAAARSKGSFRQACQASGVPFPRYVQLTAPATSEHPEQLTALREAGLKLPVVAKPNSCGGSFAVTRADSWQQLADATQAYWAGLPAYLSAVGLSASSSTSTGGMLVEELIEGHEVDVDCIAFEGKLLLACVSDNHPCKPLGDQATFIETGCSCPSVLPESAQAEILQLTARVVGMFGSSLSGVLHFEAKYNADTLSAMPIELNMRIGGAETYTNIKAAWGVDLARAALRISHGLRPQLPRHLASYMAATAAMSDGAAALGVPQACDVPHASPVLPAAVLPAGTVHLAKMSHAAISSYPTRCVGESLTQDLPRAASRRAADHSQLLDDTSMVTRLSCQCECMVETSESSDEGSGSSCSSDCLSRYSIGTASVDTSCGATGSQHQTQTGFAHELAMASQPAFGTPGAGAAVTSGEVHMAGNGAIQVLPASSGETASAHATSAGYASSAACASSAAARDSPSNLDLVTQQSGCSILMLPPLSYVCSINFVPEWRGLGLVEKFELSPTAYAEPCYVDSELYLKPGDIAKLPPAGFSALGWMVAKSSGSAEAAAQALELLTAHLTIHLSTPP